MPPLNNVEHKEHPIGVVPAMFGGPVGDVSVGSDRRPAGIQQKKNRQRYVFNKNLAALSVAVAAAAKTAAEACEGT